MNLSFRKLVPLLACLFAGSAAGQIVSVGPFVGDLQEGFEGSNTCCSTTCVSPGGLFGGGTEFCSTGVGSMGASSGFNIGACAMQPRTGNRAARSFEAHPEFSFSEPVRQVGGYLKVNAHGGTVRGYAYDSAGNVIGNTLLSLPHCQWFWVGWESHGSAISRMRLQFSLPEDSVVLYDDWELTPEPPVISSFCASNVNSTGMAATMGFAGSSSLQANDLSLVVSFAPVGQIGLFIQGTSEGQIPLGNGFLCVAGQFKRLRPAQIVNAGGQMIQPYDIGNAPGGTLVVGQTLKFQAWFRDPAGGGSNTNLTDGLSVTFVP